ncbi:MAG: AAA family ATPase [Firmicutes bacterium]|nr:AAA family ATPase [Bacillota bacterium]
MTRPGQERSIQGPGKSSEGVIDISNDNAKLIAVAGKGGTGKTTVAALLIRYLIEQRKKPILAVDADPNANLNEALGLEVPETISDVLEEMKDNKAIPGGMNKFDFLEYRLSGVLAEGKDVDLLVMGTPEGAGCYCYPNDMLSRYLERLSKNYPFIIMDNEAGMEHLSRRVARTVDALLVISDSSARGIRSAGRVAELVKALKLDVKEMHLVITKTNGDLRDLQEEIEKTGLSVVGAIPLDPQVVEFDLKGLPLYRLPGDSAAVRAVYEIARKVKLVA